MIDIADSTAHPEMSPTMIMHGAHVKNYLALIINTHQIVSTKSALITALHDQREMIAGGA